MRHNKLIWVEDTGFDIGLLMMAVGALCLVLAFFMMTLFTGDIRCIGAWFAYPCGFWFWIVGSLIVGFFGFIFRAEP